MLPSRRRDRPGTSERSQRQQDPPPARDDARERRYQVAESHGDIATIVLEEKKVLVVATGDGFKDAEIATIEQWVRGGGSLLLAANRLPSPSLRKLGSRFGVELNAAARKDHGQGRVAVLGDTTLLGEQRGGDPKRTLEVVNWLSRAGTSP
jgi:hypothetical protein